MGGLINYKEIKMLDLGNMCYRDEQHKEKYEVHPQNFEMVTLTFDEEGKLKKAIRKKTGKMLSIFDLERLVEELDIQLSEDWQSGPFMEFQ